MEFDGNSIDLMKAEDDKNFSPLASFTPVFPSSVTLLHSVCRMLERMAGLQYRNKIHMIGEYDPNFEVVTSDCYYVSSLLCT